jgi:hypothetical protein
MVMATTIDLSPVPPDVSELARQKDVASCMRPLLALAGEIFPGSSIAARFERDAEVDSEPHKKTLPGGDDPPWARLAGTVAV